jgi:hypothetical protein
MKAKQTEMPIDSSKEKATGRPKGGYVNAAGKRVPGVTTILGRWRESGGLIQWAYQCGRDGIDINAARDRAADAGTAVHEMIDAHLHGRPFDRTAWKPNILQKADHCFLAFLEWAEQSKLAMKAAELSLVSEKHQFAGTFDAAMFSGNSLRLLDYKSASGVYVDQLCQVAGGYSLLWQEHFPDQPLGGIDILRVSKPDAEDDPVSFEHRHWSAEVIPIAQEQFLLLRAAYDLDKRLKGLL